MILNAYRMVLFNCIINGFGGPEKGGKLFLFSNCDIRERFFSFIYHVLIANEVACFTGIFKNVTASFIN